MKPTNLFKASVLIILLGLIISCEQNNGPKGFDKMFTDYATPSQSFTVNASVNSTIVGSRGTIINIPANSFTGPGGIVSGNVTFNLTEVYDKSEMLFNQRPTVSYGIPLISGGVINISASQNGQQLSLANDIFALMPVTNTSVTANTDMEVFAWITNDSLPESNGYWNPTGDSANAGGSWSYDGNAYTGIYYEVQFDNMSWINCDAFYNQTPSSDIEAIGPDGYSASNTRVFAIFNNLNSCIELQYGWWCSNSFCTQNIPVGTGYSIAAIHYDEASDSFSSSITTGLSVGASGNQTTLNFSTTTIAQFNSAVSAL